MRNLRIFLVIFGLLATTFPMFAQKKAPSSKKIGIKAASAKSSCCSVPKDDSAGEFSDKSLYQTNALWQNQHGKTVKLADFSGKIVVATMIFTNCRYACPQIIADVQLIAEQLPPEIRASVHFVFITMDVQRDTPKAMKTFAESMNLPEKNWTFLHGNEDDTREIAALLGIKYKKMPDESFSHSNIITVLNQRGEIALQQTGLKTDSAPTVEKIKKLF